MNETEVKRPMMGSVKFAIIVLISLPVIYMLGMTFQSPAFFYLFFMDWYLFCFSIWLIIAQVGWRILRRI